jgi:hypothetical protein
MNYATRVTFANVSLFMNLRIRGCEFVQIGEAEIPGLYSSRERARRDYHSNSPIASFHSDSKKVGLNGVAQMDEAAEAPTIQSVITSENCYTRGEDANLIDKGKHYLGQECCQIGFLLLWPVALCLFEDFS